jgi:hypothetical protein
VSVTLFKELLKWCFFKMCMAYIHPMSRQKYIQNVNSSLVDDSYVTSIKWSYPSFTVHLEVNEREQIVSFVV